MNHQFSEEYSKKLLNLVASSKVSQEFWKASVSKFIIRNTSSPAIHILYQRDSNIAEQQR